MTGKQHRSSIDRGEDNRVLALQNLIKGAFPRKPYDGPITPVDGKWNVDLDEEQALYTSLKGKDWTQVPDDFISSNPDGVVLLTDEAFSAFLPAWLMRSLEAINAQNETRELLTYSFGGSSGDQPNHRIRRRLSGLSADQREALREVVRFFSDAELDPFIREQARTALKIIDSVLPPSVT